MRGKIFACISSSFLVAKKVQNKNNKEHFLHHLKKYGKYNI
jgi:hypothetical protein